MYCWYVALAHVALALCLFLLVNWLGGKSGPLGLGYVQISLSMQDDTAPAFNFFFKVLAPVVFMVLLYAFFQMCSLDRFNSYIYWIVIDYWVIRFIFNALMARIGLINWIVQVIYWVSSIGIALWVYSLFDKTSVLPSPTSLVEQLWLIIILYLYSVLNKIEPSRKNTEKRINDFVIKKYLRFHAEYDHLFGRDSQFQRALLYSIMIYEDYNRPRIARFLERVVFQTTTTSHTYGIMQVMSEHYLTNEESILIARRRINSDIAVILKKEGRKRLPKQRYEISILAWNVAQRYNPGDPDYGRHVRDIFEIVYSQYSPLVNKER